MNTDERIEELTDRQRLAIGALLTGMTQAEAAAAAGAGERTLRDWLKQPHFCRALREARSAAWSETTTRLQGSTGKAVETLNAIMDNPQARGWERVAAARTVLELSRKAAEVDDLSARLAEVEARLAGMAED